ncbi:hypothetical protein COCCADRAFT_26683 [Bipolaris zeicola 26-R-13]|uniref:Uncharacterized protein n=1 Tax=Cochliobolus carbonum (strain 26-R-13) TaxID=930089 RepID=W6YBJ2_COCC2|nr:uncharacterized protein COCCADRAFT_26683 [Bipolaris zeicola 26-R-13]EUC32869.1 hypothetical protein COCCADRAFT_26683 [Bipolaris zeicola 26-R-13]
MAAKASICFYLGVLGAEEEEHQSAPIPKAKLEAKHRVWLRVLHLTVAGTDTLARLSGPVNCIPTSREDETRMENKTIARDDVRRLHPSAAMPVETDHGPVIWNVSTNPCNVRATDVMTAVYGFSSVMSKVLDRLNKDDVVFRGRIAGVEIESHREQVPSSAHVVVPGLRKEWIQATAHFVEITQWRPPGNASRGKRRQATKAMSRAKWAGQEAAAGVAAAAAAGAGICIGRDSTVEIF